MQRGKLCDAKCTYMLRIFEISIVSMVSTLRVFTQDYVDY